jgi:hypothetical protein
VRIRCRSCTRCDVTAHTSDDAWLTAGKTPPHVLSPLRATRTAWKRALNDGDGTTGMLREYGAAGSDDELDVVLSPQVHCAASPHGPVPASGARCIMTDCPPVASALRCHRGRPKGIRQGSRTQCRGVTHLTCRFPLPLAPKFARNATLTVPFKEEDGWMDGWMDGAPPPTPT